MVQLLLLLMVMLYAFPLEARFENTIWNTLKNAAILAIYCLPKTLLMIVITLAIPSILLFVPIPGPLLPYILTLDLIMGGALAIYLNSLLISRIFERFFHSEGKKPEDETLQEPL